MKRDNCKITNGLDKIIIKLNRIFYLEMKEKFNKFLEINNVQLM
jgi:hypothetical protein